MLIAIVAYLRLIGLAPDSTTRYRIGLVGTSLLVWLGAILILNSLDVAAHEWNLILALLGLLAPLLVIAAYFPPPPLKRRWNLAALDEGGEH